MNIYRIMLDEGKINDIEHHVMAKDFDDAVAQAHKLLQHQQAQDIDPKVEMEIVEISKKFELEVVK